MLQCGGLLLLLGVFACSGPEPLRIGFLGTLSGRFSDLSNSGGNGVRLALEECNAAGGVQGRQVELIEADDQVDEAAALVGLKSLKDRGVFAVVGPMISKTAIAVAPEAAKLGLVLMAPTVSANQLTGIDDGFFRVYTPSEQTSRQLARQVWQLGARRVSGVYDLTNQAHTQGAYRSFCAEFSRLGGEVLPEITFHASSSPSFTALAREAAGLKVDALFVLMGTLDTALFSQCLAKAGVKPLLCCTDWSGTGDLAQFGGKAIDGLVFLYSMNRSGNASFRQAYQKRFGSEPDFAALRSYEATWVLLQALRHNPDPLELRKTLLALRRFRVGDEAIEFDAYGDVARPHFPYRLIDGRMESLPVAP